MNKKLFSPILKSSQEAFVLKSPSIEYTILFTIPSLVDKNEIKHMQVRITKQKDNKSIINTNDFPDGIYYTEDFTSTSISLLPSKVFTKGNFEAGTLYKIQIRFGYCNLWKTKSEFAGWKEQAIKNEDFSEWSTVMAIKCLHPVDLDITSLTNHLVTTMQPTFSALTSFNPLDNEIVDTYKFTLLQNDIELETSDWQQHLEINENLDSYKFQTILEDDSNYTLKYSIRSINGYEQEKEETFMTMDNYFVTLRNIFLDTSATDSENGSITVNISTSDDLLFGNFVITRSDEKSNYKKWQDLHYFFLSGTPEYNFVDYTVEDGVCYRYALQSVNDRGLRSAPLYDEHNDYAMVYFEHSYIVGEGRQLKLEYNLQLNSFKHTVLASKQDTLGSKYPTIMRNGSAYYAEFPISGLISVKMDEDNTFSDKDSTINHNLTHENINTERLFREEVEAFLNDGKCKLFRSSTEGNILITLMNVSLTPNTTVGRMLYNFSATAYEVADVSLSSLLFNNIISKDIKKEDSKLVTMPQLGNTIHSTNLMYPNWLESIKESTYKYIPSSGYELTLDEVPYLEIIAGSTNITLTVAGQTIIVPAHKRYIYPQPIKYPTIVNISNVSDGATINYTYSLKVIASESIVITDAGRIKAWGQMNDSQNLNYTNFMGRFLQKLIADGSIPGSNSNITFNGQNEYEWTIKYNKRTYHLNKFDYLEIDAPANSLFATASGKQIRMNNTNILRYENVLADEFKDYTIQLPQKDYLINFVCTIDWIEEA